MISLAHNLDLTFCWMPVLVRVSFSKGRPCSCRALFKEEVIEIGPVNLGMAQRAGLEVGLLVVE